MRPKKAVTVVTRYEAPSGQVIVHAYGPYATRGKARTLRDRVLRDARADGYADRISVHLCTLIDVDDVRSDFVLKVPAQWEVVG